MKKLLLILLFCSAAPAELVRNQFEGIRPAGMGNAFVALADDDNVLWYNPAALARSRSWHFNAVDLTLGVDGLSTLGAVGDTVFKGDPNRLVRNNNSQEVGAKVKPGLYAPYFAVTFFEHFKGFFDVNNVEDLLNGSVDVFAFNDIGLMAGIGLPINRYLSIGAAARIFQRSAVDLNLTSQELITQLGLSDPTEFTQAIYDHLATQAGTGWGVGLNLGVLLEVPTGARSPRWFLAATVEDAGKTSFQAFGSLTVPPPQKTSYHFGTALRYKTGRDSEVNLAVDLRHALSENPFFKKLHLGVEYRTGLFGLRGGLHQGQWTAGASLTFPPHTRLHFATYAFELGNTLMERGARTYQLQLVIGFNPI